MLILFISFFGLLIVGMPVSFSMLLSSMAYMIVNNIDLVMVLPRLAAGVNSFPLLAVGLFVFAGNIMNTGGVTKRIFSWANHLVGHHTGGLAHSNVVASVIFSGMSGSAIADTGGLGAIELKAMKDGGYDDDFSLAVTGASSLIGPIIPPSVPLIIFGVSANVSVGKLFNSGIIPGLILAILFMVLNYFICKDKNYPKRKKATGRELWDCTKWAFASLLLPLIIRGGIAFGVFSPTEASVIAVVYGLFLGFLYKDIKIKKLANMILETMKVTTSVLFIISSATLFSWVLTFSQFPQMVTTALMQLTTNPFLALLIIVLILLVVGLVMDLTPAIVILTPVFMPFITSLGIDPVLFGLLMVVCLLVGLITPPVGMVLFVLSGVSGVGVEKISKAIIPHIIVSIILILALVVYMSLLMKFPNIPLIYW